MRLINWRQVFGRGRTETKGFATGAEPSPKDERDFDWSQKTIVYPSRVGESPSTFNKVLLGKPEIKQQGSWNSCAGHAVATACELLQKTTMPLSERYVWGKARSHYMRTFPQNTGVYLRDAVKVAQRWGVAPEVLCRYRDEEMNDAPSLFAESFARWYRVKSYFRCYSVAAMQEALVAGYPLVIGVRVWPEFVSLRQRLAYRSEGQMLGNGHAMCVYGGDGEGAYVTNSWGFLWGQHGNCVMPWGLLGDPLITFETWAITDLEVR